MPKNNLNTRYTYGIAIGNSIPFWKPYLFGGSIEESIKKAKDWGYAAVELHNISVPKETDTEKILRELKDFNIEVSAISTGPSYYHFKLSLTDESHKIRKKAVDRLKEYIDLASIIGGLVTIGTMRGNIPDLESLSTYKSRLKESLKEASFYAGEKDITLLIEVVNRYEINYLNRVDEIFDFIVSSDIPMTKIHMDTFHMNIEEVDICKAIIDHKELLGYFHIADSNRMYPGAGHINFLKILS